MEQVKVFVDSDSSEKLEYMVNTWLKHMGDTITIIGREVSTFAIQGVLATKLIITVLIFYVEKK